MNFGDKKTVLIAGIAGAVIVIALAVIFLMQRKPATTAAQGGQGGTATGAGTAAGGAQVAGGGGAPAGAGGTQLAAAVPGQTLGAAPATVNLLGAVNKGSGEMTARTRPDPLINIEPPPPKLTPEDRYLPPAVYTVEGGLRPAGAEIGTTETIANHRVAGIKFGGGAWAILEKDGRTRVVKPGDVVQGTKVTAIGRNSVFVVDAEGRKWQVPLKAADPTTAAATTTTTRQMGAGSRATN
jgi:hypothetical protein